MYDPEKALALLKKKKNGFFVYDRKKKSFKSFNIVTTETDLKNLFERAKNQGIKSAYPKTISGKPAIRFCFDCEKFYTLQDFGTYVKCQKCYERPKQRSSNASVAVVSKCTKEICLQTMQAKELEFKKALNAKELEFKKVLNTKELEFKEVLKAKESEFKKALNAKELEFKEALKAKELEFASFQEKVCFWNKNI
jgi:hypothetical protein